MLTPTGVTSSAYWAAIKSGNPTHVRITFLGQEIVLTDADIDISGGIRITDILNGETDLVFGKAVCKQVEMTIINSDRLSGLLWTSEFKLEMGVEIGNPVETNWITIGYFSGEKPQNVTTVRKIEFTAYDRMTLFDGLADDYVKSIEYPATLQDIYDGLCESVGIENAAGNELPDIMTRLFDVAPAEMEGYTCRDMLAWIAEACGCYAKINSAGKCQMVWFTDNTGHEVSENEEYNVETGDVNSGMIWNEADTFTWDEIGVMTWNDVTGYEEAFSIDEVMVKQLGNDLDINYPGPYGGNVYMIVENPFLSVGSNTDLNNFIVPIYNRLSVFGGYLPVNLHCIGNWCVEAGDVITIAVNDMEISFPIFVKTMTWNGAINDEYETTGNINREIYTSEKNKQKVLENNKIELYVNALEEEVDQNYYKIRSGIEILSTGVEISGNKYVSIKSGSSFKVESGGIVDIHASGTLELTGTSVSIKSNSTFDLDSDNFKINSIDKYIHIPIDSDDTWIFDQYGLRMYNSTRQKNVIRFTGEFTGGSQTQTPDVGVYAYTPGGDTTHGRLALISMDRVSNTYSYLYFEHDNTKSYFLPGISNLVQIGSSDKRFTHAYINVLHPYQVYMPNNAMYFDNANGDFRCVFNSNESLQKFQIYNSEPGFYIELTGTVVSPSSRSKKHNIQSFDDTGNIIDKLEPVSFVYNEDRNNKKHFGLIYEDTVGILPEICIPGDEKTDKAINYVELVPVLLKEIKSLRKRVEKLEEVKA